MTSTEIRQALLATILSIIGIIILLFFATITLRNISQPLVAILAVPFLILAKSLPSFIAGWRLQPRHPLIFGFISASIAMLVINGELSLPSFEPYSLAGEALGAGIVSSLAMFSGRQLKRMRRST
jgi:hypothetical protein